LKKHVAFGVNNVPVTVITEPGPTVDVLMLLTVGIAVLTILTELELVYEIPSLETLSWIVPLNELLVGTWQVIWFPFT
jgi:hypothetical protein